MNQIVLTDTDLERIQLLTGDDLAKLYQTIQRKLARPAVLGNCNAVTTRLPLEVVRAISTLALKHRITRSHIVREAVLRFLASQQH